MGDSTGEVKQQHREPVNGGGRDLQFGIKSEELFPDYPFITRVRNLPDDATVEEFAEHLKAKIDVPIEKITQAEDKSILVHCSNEHYSELFLLVLEGDTFKENPLTSSMFIHPDLKQKRNEERKRKREDFVSDEDATKKPKIECPRTPDYIVNMIVHYTDISYEDQLKIQTTRLQSLCSILHAELCYGNTVLPGWAAAMLAKNNGFLLEVGGTYAYPDPKEPHHYVELRLGRNDIGDISLGYVNKVSGKIISAHPGERFIHLTDSMRLVAMYFEDYVRANPRRKNIEGLEHGHFHRVLIKRFPDESLCLIIHMYYEHLSKAQREEVFQELKDWFTTGEGKACNLASMYVQPIVLGNHNKLKGKEELVFGNPPTVEDIEDIAIIVGPLNCFMMFNRSTCPLVRDSVVDLGKITPDTNVLYIGHGTGAINVLLAKKCNKLVVVEQVDVTCENLKATFEDNDIKNAEVMTGEEVSTIEAALKSLGTEKEIVLVLDGLKPQIHFKLEILKVFRAHASITRVVYLFLLAGYYSNLPAGVKNLSVDSKKGVTFEGDPFLPVKIAAVDISPFRKDKLVVMSFQREDPSVYPQPEVSPPLPNYSKMGKKEGFSLSGAKKRKNKLQALQAERQRKGHKFPMNTVRGRMEAQRAKRPPLHIRRRQREHGDLINRLENRIAELEHQQRSYHNFMPDNYGNGPPMGQGYGNRGPYSWRRDAGGNRNRNWQGNSNNGWQNNGNQWSGKNTQWMNNSGYGNGSSNDHWRSY